MYAFIRQKTERETKLSMKKLEVKTVPLSSLHPFPGNPRRHGPDIDALVKSVAHYGWTNPILIQRGTGRIIAGHGRYEAAKKAGLAEVPVIELDLDDRDASAYTMADNKLAENSEWDFKLLQENLCELDDGAFDMALTGFGEEELKKMVDWEPLATTPSDGKIPQVKLEMLVPSAVWLAQKAAIVGALTTILTQYGIECTFPE